VTPTPKAAAPSTPATPATPKQPIREDVVASCVAFLNHPKVKGSPQESKLQFLKKKGLTQDEIDESFRRAEGGAASVPATTAAQPRGTYLIILN
jgi:hypothetical protein